MLESKASFDASYSRLPSFDSLRPRRLSNSCKDLSSSFSGLRIRSSLKGFGSSLKGFGSTVRSSTSASLHPRELVQLATRTRGSTTTSTRGERASTVNRLIALNQREVFPPELFSDIIELLEVELAHAMQRRSSKVFSKVDFTQLLRAHETISNIHGHNLHEWIVDELAG